MNVTGTTSILMERRTHRQHHYFIDAGGTKIVLNEETITGNGTSSRDIRVDAFDVTFTSVSFASPSPRYLERSLFEVHSER